MASKQGEKSEQDMLEQLEVAKKDLMRALELLNQPVETAVSVPQSPARSGSPRRSVSPVGKASAAGVAPSSVPVVPTEGIDREALIIQLRDLRAALEQDQEKAKLALQERDEEIARLRRLVDELQQHHYLPPLSFRYEPPTPPSESAYRGPLLLPQEVPEQPPSWQSWDNIDVADRHRAEEDLNRTVMVYMLDGSQKYTPMTVNAIESLHQSSPGLNIGIITQDIDAARLALSHIPARFTFMPRSEHFAGWNPTQFKLDMLQFGSLFETVVWMDSDTFVYRDIRPLLLSFYRSKKPYGFMPDLVMNDPGFRQRWVGDKRRVFVPQASLMMFRAGAMPELFVRWEEKWREWIFPAPFARFSDPMPDFEGSAFCIEQYALGMALEDLMQDIANDIFVLNRDQVFMRLLEDGDALDIYAVPFRYAYGIGGLSGVTSYGSARFVSLSMAAGFNTSARVVMQGSYAGSYATSSGGLIVGPVGAHMVDNVGQCVLHLYNTQYEVVYRLVRARQEEIVARLQEMSGRMSS